MNDETSVAFTADKFTVAGPEYRPIYSVQQQGWEWVSLPKPTLMQRLLALWRGAELKAEELRPRMVIGIRGDLFADGTISSERIAGDSQ